MRQQLSYETISRMINTNGNDGLCRTKKPPCMYSRTDNTDNNISSTTSAMPKPIIHYVANMESEIWSYNYLGMQIVLFKGKRLII